MVHTDKKKETTQKIITLIVITDAVEKSIPSRTDSKLDQDSNCAVKGKPGLLIANELSNQIELNAWFSTLCPP